MIINAAEGGQGENMIANLYKMVVVNHGIEKLRNTFFNRYMSD